MKRIAIYGEVLNTKHGKGLQRFFDTFQKSNVKGYIYQPYFEKLKLANMQLSDSTISVFNTRQELIENNIEIIVSIGGDGTMLNAFGFAFKSEISVFGINTGRLGFLSTVTADEASDAIKNLIEGTYLIKRRTVLEVTSNLLNEPIYAVNEVTIHKQDSASMLTVHATLDDHVLNSYWADGIIIATPTGSTAYSLSTGGPVVMPGSENFIITPIAPHNLTVRPLVYRDDKEMDIKVESRTGTFLMAYDSHSISMDTSAEIHIRKADFYIKLLKLYDYNYLQTLRAKLMWGVDKRN
jgi:NAD+ kinase